MLLSANTEYHNLIGNTALTTAAQVYKSSPLQLITQIITIDDTKKIIKTGATTQNINTDNDTTQKQNRDAISSEQCKTHGIRFG